MTYLCSRWAEVIPLKHLKAEDIAEVLLYVFCRMGFLDVIPSNNGTQFISQTMHSFTDMLSIALTFSSRYHPQLNGVLEISKLA